VLYFHIVAVSFGVIGDLCHRAALHRPDRGPGGGSQVDAGVEVAHGRPVAELGRDIVLIEGLHGDAVRAVDRIVGIGAGDEARFAVVALALVCCLAVVIDVVHRVGAIVLAILPGSVLAAVHPLLELGHEALEHGAELVEHSGGLLVHLAGLSHLVGHLSELAHLSHLSGHLSQEAHHFFTSCKSVYPGHCHC